MLEFMAYRKLYNGGTIWEIKDNEYKKLEAEELPMYIAEKVQKLRQTTTIYIHGLTVHKEAFLQALYFAGVDFIEGNPKVSKMEDMTAKYLISGEMSRVYQITVKNHSKALELIDADNILPTEQKVLDTWGRHEELSYVKAYERGINDFNEICLVKQKKPMTASAGARNVVKKMLPYLELMDANKTDIDGLNLDDLVRPAYKGGLCVYKDMKDGKATKKYGSGICLDVNSLYPYVMVKYPLPITEPKYHTGGPTEQELIDMKRERLVIWVKIKAAFKIKKDGIPCIRTDEWGKQKGWLTDSGNVLPDGTIREYIDGERVKCELTLTYIDFLDFLQEYEVEELTYIHTVTMTAVKGIFNPVIQKLYKEKRHSTGGRRSIVKIVLNSLSGLVSRRKEYYTCYIDISDSGEISVKTSQLKSEGGKSYIYMGSYITSYARHFILEEIRKNYERWLYTDTDCLILKGSDTEGFEIGEGLGKWKLDKEFDEFYTYGQKQYGYRKDGKVHFTLAGVAEEDRLQIEDKYYILMEDIAFWKDMDIKTSYGRQLEKVCDDIGWDLESFIAEGIRNWQPIMLENCEDMEQFDLNLRRTRPAEEVIMHRRIFETTSILDDLPKLKIPCTRYKGIDFEIYKMKTYINFSDIDEFK